MLQMFPAQHAMTPDVSFFCYPFFLPKVSTWLPLSSRKRPHLLGAFLSELLFKISLPVLLSESCIQFLFF